MKPRVMVFSRCYLPGFRGGGPVRSLVNLVQALGTEFDFRIITRDRDEGVDQPYPSVMPGTWQAVEGAQVRYVPRSAISVRWLAREIETTSPQLLYLNSFFDSIFTLKVLVARRSGMLPSVPVLLAPQGELSPGALGIKSRKKAAYIRFARLCGLYRGLEWQASSDTERNDILNTLTDVAPAHVRVAADLTERVDDAPLARAPRSPSGPLRLCFLSRISPKKNLDLALRVLAAVKVPVDFMIYGPVEDTAHWAACQRLIAQLPPHIQVQYGGALLPEQVRDALSQYDLFFFPTRGENFGHVIFEALRAGVPVLISDQTPWRDLEAHGAGWSVPLHATEAFVRVIETASRELPVDRENAARRAVAYAAWRIDRTAGVQAAHDLFRSLIQP